MSGYGARLGKLEKAMAPPQPPERWHQIIQRIGENEEEAIADYEANYGHIGPDDHIIIRRIVAPDPERFNEL